MRNILKRYLGLCACVLLAGCSATRHLPDGEILYTGVGRIDATTADSTKVPDDVLASVKTALEVPPNGALFGSAYYRFPPVGLWLGSALYTERETGLRHWLWSKLKSDPVLLSQVNPPLRSQAAFVTMSDEGYFGGEVTCDTLLSHRHPRQAKLNYSLRFPRAKHFGNVRFMPSGVRDIDSLLRATSAESRIQSGGRFRASALEGEKERIEDLLLHHGYSFYKSQFVRFLADSTLNADSIALRVYVEPEKNAALRSRVDSVAVLLDFGNGSVPNRFDTTRRFVSIGYRGKLMMRPTVLRRTVPFAQGELYRPEQATSTKTRLSRLNTFRYSSIDYELMHTDTVNHLLMRVDATYNYPWASSLEFRALTKDNHQTGPGMSLQLQRRNLFGGGELLTTELTAGYEWATGHHAYADNDGLLNSYEFGLKSSLVIPKLDLPRWLVRVDRDYPTSTTYSLSANTTRRSGFFQMMKATAEVRYDFYTSDVVSHSIAPVRLSYTHMMNTSHRFDSVVGNNRVLQQSFADQFIPKVEYTFTYDNRNVATTGKASRQPRTPAAHRLTQQWLQVTLAESGNIVDAVLGWSGKRPQGQRQLLWQKFSQFVKATVDFRNYFELSRRLTLATRLYGGVVYAYGNSDVVPFSEQFYIGGANSLRGFSIRSVGPGDFHPDGGQYSYMDQTGDVKLEANAELRFPLLGDLKGAVFADAGNVWTLRNEAMRRGGQIGADFWQELATDAGLGLRYDLGMLVIRFDVGVPIHDPSVDDDRYYNVRAASPKGFFKHLGYHLAVGYPF